MQLLILDAEEFAFQAADHIARELLEQARVPGILTLALSGGTTPRPVNRTLAGRRDIPWDRMDLFFADERAVPPDDPDSNYRMVRESLLDHLPLPPHMVHPIETKDGNLERAALDYAGVLPPRLDLLLLGLGEDGHIASLFPGQTDPDDPRPVFPVNAPKPPPQRITLGPVVIRGARRRIVLARGDAKAAAVALACEGPWNPSACPGQLAREALWILDRPAAGRLRSVTA